MAKFCTKCGKKLEEGQTCDCAKNVKTESTEAVDVKQSFMDSLNVFKKIVTKPIEAIKDFVKDNKFVAGIILIVLAALAAGIYKIATLKSMSSSTTGSGFSASDLGSIFGSMLGGGSLSDIAKPNYFKEFMTTFAYSLLEYAALVFIGYLIISKLFKGNISLKKMVCMVGISLSVVFAADIINSLVVFIDGEVFGYIRSYINTFATIFSTLILYESVKEVAEVNKEKVFLAVATTSISATMVIDIAHKIFK